MDITAISVVGIVIWGTYRLFELFARKKERMAIIEKIDKLDTLDFKGDLNLPLCNSNTRFGSLRIALLFIGIGLGCLLGLILASIFELANYETQGVLYFSTIAVFGGLGLLISYLIEMKGTKK